MRPGLRFIGFPPLEEKKRFHRFDVEPEGVTPEIREHTDLLALPKWTALYDLSGNRIEVTKRKYVATDLPKAKHILERVAKGDEQFNPVRIDVPKDYDVVDHPVFYAGVAWGHFGHFLTDGMSRFWGLATAGDLPVVYLDHEDPLFASLKFPKPILQAVGLSGERMLRIERPTLFRRIVVPVPSIQHAHRIYRNHDYGHRITAAKVLQGRESAWANKSVYLSRSGLNSKLRKSSDEMTLQDRLEGLGFDIVYPERLTLVDQIDIFNNAKVVAGMMGSAFHGALFTLPGSRTKIVMLCWQKVNSRYIMQDCIKQYEATYISCCTLNGMRLDGQFDNISINVDAALSAIVTSI